MQVPDESDPRRPGVKVAASIRAAILSGELKPGEQLPSATELAEQFGVARMTVQNALRKLRDEGYVDIRGSVGTYVSDRPRSAEAESEIGALTGTAAFLYEMGYLKTMPRSGWLRLGVKVPESVAEHSFRVTIIGMALAALEHADPNRTAALCVFHDGHETRIGDVPAPARAYVTTKPPEVITAHQTSRMPDDVGKLFQDLTTEYEATETLESRVAHDADKLETLLQAVEYGEQGYDTEAWKQTSIDALRTESGVQLARAINATSPEEWWIAFAESYHELRRDSRGRSS